MRPTRDRFKLGGSRPTRALSPPIADEAFITSRGVLLRIAYWAGGSNATPVLTHGTFLLRTENPKRHALNPSEAPLHLCEVLSREGSTHHDNCPGTPSGLQVVPSPSKRNLDGIPGRRPCQPSRHPASHHRYRRCCCRHRTGAPRTFRRLPVPCRPLAPRAPPAMPSTTLRRPNDGGPSAEKPELSRSPERA